MLIEDDKRMLTEEVLGEEWDQSILAGGLPNRTFTTWQDLGDLKNKIAETGEWCEGDRFCIDGEVWTIGDYFMTGDGLFGTDGHVIYFYWDDMVRATWIPPLSDPIQPERGLTGLMEDKS